MTTRLEPASIKKYSVIRLPHKFIEALYHERKRFVVLGHKGGNLICIKATAQVEVYKNNSGLMASCVYYSAGEVAFFEKDTVIQPDNPVPISYEQVLASDAEGEFEILGEMPDSFEADLVAAIEDSITLPRREAKRLLKIIRS